MMESASLDIPSLLGRPIFWYVFCLVSFLAAIAFRWIAQRSPSKHPPIFEKVPFIGGILSFLAGPLHLIHEGYTTKGEVFTVPVLHKKLTFLIGPHVLEPFFKLPDDAVSQDEVYRFNIPTFGPGVVYDVHHKIRGEQFRMFGEALKTESLNGYLPLFQMETMEFFQKWKSSGLVDLTKELGQLTTLTASRTLLGREIRENLFAEVSDLLHDLDAGMIPLSFFAPYIPIPCHHKRDQSRLKLKTIFDRVIQQRRESNIQEADMLQHFIDSKYIRCNDGRFLNDDEIGGLLIAALFAGQHTSSVTSAWTGYFLIYHQEWWQKCVKEQEEIIAQHGEEITYETLDKMEILHSCIREALRINPPLVMVMRYVKKAFTVTTRKGIEYTIPEGHIAITSPAYAGTLSHIYSDPDVYNPMRLVAPLDEDKKIPFSYLPFGGGRHSCMGHNFAFLQIKTIWSYLLRNFTFKVMDPFPKPDHTSMVTGIKPCRVSYTRRQEA